MRVRAIKDQELAATQAPAKATGASKPALVEA